MMETMYHTLLYAMPVLAVIVFIALFFVKAGYGIFQSRQWGISLPNKVGWVLMECPAFLMMLFFWLQSPARSSSVLLSFFLLFELHYFQRSFIFPMLMKGKSRMPIAITATTPSFIGGCLLFFGGMGINLHADHIIRNLRPAGDTRHYLPQKGIYHYVTSGNYFGELVEWTGFALLTQSTAAWIFVLWTFANLAPRAYAIRNRYREEFGREAVGSRKCLIPYIF